MRLRITKYFEAYASYIGQALWVFISFFVLTVFPILFGIEAYGKFAATTAITFIFQRIIDLVAESNISDGTHRDTIKSTVVLGVLVCLLGLLFDFINNSNIFRVDYLLLSSLISSNLILNISFQLLSSKLRAIYLLSFSIVTIVLSGTFWIIGNKDISALLTLINFTGALLGSLFIAANRWSGVDQKHRPETKHDKPSFQFSNDTLQRVLFSSFSIFVTYGTVLIASHFLSYNQVGILRIFLTVASIGNFISPVNPKEFYNLSKKMETSTDLYKFYSDRKRIYGIFVIGWLAVYAYLVLFSTKGISIFIPAFSLYATTLVSSVVEKVALFKLRLSRMSLVVASYTAVATVALLIPHTLNSFALALAVVIILYPIYLTTILRAGFLRIAIAPVALSAICVLLTLLARPHLLN